MEEKKRTRLQKKAGRCLSRDLATCDATAQMLAKARRDGVEEPPWIAPTT